MDTLLARYADLIIRLSLNLKAGDILSINTEESNSDFAHLVATEARKITGNGSYILYIESGKIVETEEAATDFPINKNPTALLYLPVIKRQEAINSSESVALELRRLQEYGHLAEPLFNREPALPFSAAPLPSASWGEAIDEEGGYDTSLSLLSTLFSLEEDSYLKENEDKINVNEYEVGQLNSLRLAKGRLTNEEGTDLTFSFLKESEFASFVGKTTDGRRFVQSIAASAIFRALDSKSVNGYLTITKPISLFGVIVTSLNVEFKDGRIVNFSTDEATGSLFNLFLGQDKNASRASMLTLSEERWDSDDSLFYSYGPWDAQRGVSITIGGPRSEGLIESERANDSIVTLTLPVGSSTTTVVAYDENGEEFTIYEDGLIQEEE